MFRFSTSIRTQDNITSHFCLIARRIGTPYHQMSKVKAVFFSPAARESCPWWSKLL